MPDEVNPSEMEKEVTPTETVIQDVDPASETPTVDYAQQIADLTKKLEEQQKHISELNQESAERRVKLKEYEEAEEARRLENMSELERAQATAKTWEEKHNTAIAEWESKYQQLEQQVQEQRISTAVERAAQEAGFAHPLDAVALVDLSSLSIDDEGKVTGFEEPLKKLAESGRLAMSENVTELGTPARGDKTPKVQSKGQKREDTYSKMRRFNL